MTACAQDLLSTISQWHCSILGCDRHLDQPSLPVVLTSIGQGKDEYVGYAIDKRHSIYGNKYSLVGVPPNWPVIVDDDADDDDNANNGDVARPIESTITCQPSQCRESRTSPRILDQDAHHVHGSSACGSCASTAAYATRDGSQRRGGHHVDHCRRSGSGGRVIRSQGRVQNVRKRTKRGRASTAANGEPSPVSRPTKTLLPRDMGQQPTTFLVVVDNVVTATAAATTAADTDTDTDPSNSIAMSKSGAYRRKCKRQRQPLWYRLCNAFGRLDSDSGNDIRPEPPSVGWCLLMVTFVVLLTCTDTVKATSTRSAPWLLSDDAIRFSYVQCCQSETCRHAYYLTFSSLASTVGDDSNHDADRTTTLPDFNWELFQHLYGIFAQQHSSMPVVVGLQQCFSSSSSCTADQDIVRLWLELITSNPFCGANEAFVVGVGCRCREGAQCEHDHILGAKILHGQGYTGTDATSVHGPASETFFALRGDIGSLHLLLIAAVALVVFVAFVVWNMATQNQAELRRLTAMLVPVDNHARALLAQHISVIGSGSGSGEGKSSQSVAAK